MERQLTLQANEALQVTGVSLKCIENDALLGVAENMCLTTDGQYVLTLASQMLLVQKLSTAELVMSCSYRSLQWRASDEIMYAFRLTANKTRFAVLPNYGGQVNPGPFIIVVADVLSRQFYTYNYSFLSPCGVSLGQRDGALCIWNSFNLFMHQESSLKLHFELDNKPNGRFASHYIESVLFDDANSGLVFVVMKCYSASYQILVLSLIENVISDNLEQYESIPTFRAEVIRSVTIRDSALNIEGKFYFRTPTLTHAGDGLNLVFSLRYDQSQFSIFFNTKELKLGKPLTLSFELARHDCCLVRIVDEKPRDSDMATFYGLVKTAVDDASTLDLIERENILAPLRNHMGARIVSTNKLAPPAPYTRQLWWFQLRKYTGENLTEPFAVELSPHHWSLHDEPSAVPIYHLSWNVETKECDAIAIYHPGCLNLTRNLFSRFDWVYNFHRPFFVTYGLSALNKLCNLQILAEDEKLNDVQLKLWRFNFDSMGYSARERSDPPLHYPVCHKFSNRLLMSELDATKLLDKRCTFIFLYYETDLYLFDGNFVYKFDSHMAMQWRTRVPESMRVEKNLRGLQLVNGDAIKLVPLKPGRWRRATEAERGDLESSDEETIWHREKTATMMKELDSEVVTIALCASEFGPPEATTEITNKQHVLRAILEVDMETGLFCDEKEGFLAPVYESDEAYRERTAKEALEGKNGNDDFIRNMYSQAAKDEAILPWSAICPGFMLEGAHSYFNRAKLEDELYGPHPQATENPLSRLFIATRPPLPFDSKSHVIATGTKHAVVACGLTLALVDLTTTTVLRSKQLLKDTCNSNLFVSATPEFICIFDHRASLTVWLVTFDLKQVCRIPLLPPLRIGRNLFTAARAIKFRGHYHVLAFSKCGVEVFELDYGYHEGTLAIMLLFFPRDIALVILHYADVIPFRDFEGYPIQERRTYNPIFETHMPEKLGPGIEIVPTYKPSTL